MTDAAAIERAVLAVPHVTAMHPGPHGTAATFTSEGRIWGVRIGPEVIDVHITAASRVDLRQVGTGVRDAVRRAQPHYAGEVRVHIEDLVEPGTDAHSGRKS